jgi:hypothetical protein
MAPLEKAGRCFDGGGDERTKGRGNDYARIRGRF